MFEERSITMRYSEKYKQPNVISHIKNHICRYNRSDFVEKLTHKNRRS